MQDMSPDLPTDFLSGRPPGLTTSRNKTIGETRGAAACAPRARTSHVIDSVCSGNRLRRACSARRPNTRPMGTARKITGSPACTLEPHTRAASLITCTSLAELSEVTPGVPIIPELDHQRVKPHNRVPPASHTPILPESDYQCARVLTWLPTGGGTRRHSGTHLYLWQHARCAYRRHLLRRSARRTRKLVTASNWNSTMPGT